MNISKKLVPGYYNEFQCIGNQCEDHCCKEWSITIDKDTYMKYKKSKNIEFRNKLNNSIGRNRQSKCDSDYGKMKLVNGICPLLSNEGLCEVYINLGEENMCHTCKIYPRINNQVDDIVEKALMPSCIEAARIILMKQNPMEFYLDNEEEKDISISKVLNTSRYKNISEGCFNELRAFSISLIQNRKFSIEERLAILGLFINNINNINDEKIIIESIEKYNTYIENGIYDNLLEQFELENKIDTQLEFLIKCFNVIICSKKINNERYLKNLNNIIDSLRLNKSNTEEIKSVFKKTLESYYRPFIKEYDYVLENYLVNHMFVTLFPKSEETLLDTYLNLMIQFSMLKMNIIGMSAYYKEEMTVNKMIDIVQGFTRILGHDKYLVSNIKQNLIEKQLNTVAHIIILMGK